MDAIPGEKGVPGVNGFPGLPGRKGFSGDTGPAGYRGPDGISGKKGMDLHPEVSSFEKITIKCLGCHRCSGVSVKHPETTCNRCYINKTEYSA